MATSAAFICGACALSRKYLLPLPRTRWAGGYKKNKDIPPYCSMDPIYRPAWPGPAGLSTFSDPCSRRAGGVVRVTSHVRGGPLGDHSGPGSWSRCFLVARSLPVVPPPAPVPAQRRPLPGSASASILASDGPPWLLGSLYSSQPGGHEEVMASQRLPGSPVTGAHAGEGGACGRSSCINMVQEGLLCESLGEFADDTNQGSRSHP